MKNLRKLFLLGILFPFVSLAYAQQINWGIKAGVNMANYTNSPITSEAEPSFHVGAQVQWMFTEKLGLETGLYYSMLKIKTSYSYTYLLEYDQPEITIGGQTTFTPSYMQLPIMALYQFRLNDKMTLYPTAGIYLGYGIGGKIKATTYQINEDKKEETGSENSDYFGDITNKFDMGIGIGLNLRYSHVTFGISYDRGLINAFEDSFLSDSEGQLSIENNIKYENIKASVGYFF